MRHSPLFWHAHRIFQTVKLVRQVAVTSSPHPITTAMSCSSSHANRNHRVDDRQTRFGSGKIVQCSRALMFDHDNKHSLNLTLTSLLCWTMSVHCSMKGLFVLLWNSPLEIRFLVSALACFSVCPNGVSSKRDISAFQNSSGKTANPIWLTGKQSSRCFHRVGWHVSIISS